MVCSPEEPELSFKNDSQICHRPAPSPLGLPILLRNAQRPTAPGRDLRDLGLCFTLQSYCPAGSLAPTALMSLVFPGCAELTSTARLLTLVFLLLGCIISFRALSKCHYIKRSLGGKDCPKIYLLI